MHTIYLFVLILCKSHTNHSRKTFVSMKMTQSHRFPYHYCKYNQNLPRIDQVSPNPIYPRDRQEDTNKEEPISQFVFPRTTCEYKFHSDDELVPSFDIVGSTNHCCRYRCSNTETSDYSMILCICLILVH